uniref:Uncharacterized protein n=1 Tax=Opuntia streptacantha TaxID=393608 RepID=A0A7C9AP66_OPUST
MDSIYITSPFLFLSYPSKSALTLSPLKRTSPPSFSLFSSVPCPSLQRFHGPASRPTLNGRQPPQSLAGHPLSRRRPHNPKPPAQVPYFPLSSPCFAPFCRGQLLARSSPGINRPAPHHHIDAICSLPPIFGFPFSRPREALLYGPYSAPPVFFDHDQLDPTAVDHRCLPPATACRLTACMTTCNRHLPIASSLDLVKHLIGKVKNLNPMAFNLDLFWLINLTFYTNSKVKLLVV